MSGALAPCPRITDPDRGLAAELGIAWLACSGCGREYPVIAQSACSYCFGALEVVYDFSELRDLVNATSIARGPRSLWRYAELLPVPLRALPELGIGWTPMREAPRLAAELGLRKLWLKNDAQNLTGSFKDRAVAVALQVARRFRFKIVGCASTGNLANAVAAQAAALGFDSVVLVPRTVERNKIAPTAVHGGKVITIDGSYDGVNRLCVELVDSEPWGFVNINLRPFYAEGSKTVAFEIAEQLGWRAPRAVVLPVASGCLYRKVAQGFEEFSRLGLIGNDGTPAIFGGQAAGCAPVADAFAKGLDTVTPVKARTVASSLAIGNPADGGSAISVARRSGGAIIATPESSISEAVKLLARTEGIFSEAAGGVTIAALEHLVREGRILPSEETVAVITGNGLKTPEFTGDDGSVLLPVAARLDAVEKALAEGGPT